MTSKDPLEGFYLFSDKLALPDSRELLVVHLRLPPKVKNFIRDFDSERPTKPFSFRLRIPKQYLK